MPMNKLCTAASTAAAQGPPLLPSIFRLASLPSFPKFNTSRQHHHQVNATRMEAKGTDSDGHEFNNAEEMWREHTGDVTKKTQWYHDGVSYWQGVEASVDGVLGGYGQVNDIDVNGSEAFLQNLFSELFVDGGIDRHLVALDCGSGIGRVTKNLLIRYFNEVDLLEPVAHFLDAARDSLVNENHMALDTHKATNFFCTPLQEFTPDPGRYDVIWVQWCIGHLTDDDFMSFFMRAKIGLKPGGFFVLKENVARSALVDGAMLSSKECGGPSMLALAWVGLWWTMNQLRQQA